MSRFELSLAKDYVPSWTLVDAIRELFQNALDQETLSPDNKSSWTYNADTETLYICNKKSSLTTNSLLLGASTKTGNTATIGQFGEGYKVATLVLLRNDKPITFYNYGAREVWTTRFVKSRRYNAEVLTFEVKKKAIWEQLNNNDLTVAIGNITKQEYDDILVPANLHLQQDERSIKSTIYGDVLMDDRFSGRVYVNGLFVCKYPAYKYGYNFKPEHLKLDRDRKLVSDFDLKWLASKMWCTLGNDAVDMMALGLADVEYVSNNYSYVSNSFDLKTAAFNKFLVEHGPNAIPVMSQDDLLAVPIGYRGVVVPSGYRNLIRSSDRWVDPVKELSAVARLKLWYELFSDELSYEAKEAFEELYEEVQYL